MSTTVLVIEDNQTIRDLLKSILELHSYEVKLAIHGQDGLQLLKKSIPDVILLDMKMPVLDGPGFMKIFHEKYNNACPIITVSAANNQGDNSVHEGSDYSVEKPFDMSHLIEVIEKATSQGTKK